MEIMLRKIFFFFFFFLQKFVVFYNFYQTYQSTHEYIIHLLEGDKEVRKKGGEGAEE